MIDFHYANSANSLRVAAVLEECAIAYRGHRLDLAAGDQHAADHLRINPFGTVPVIVDPDGADGRPLTLTQSTAIMIYLAEKAGALIPPVSRARSEMLQWLQLAASDIGPANTMMLYMHRSVLDLSPAAPGFLAERFLRPLRGVEAHLASGRTHLAGELSLADLALLPAVEMRRRLLVETGGFDRLLAWADALLRRPALRRALNLVSLPRV